MEKKIEDFPLILLAGGRSFRMGTPKGLLDYHGQPWLVEQLRRFKAVFRGRAIVVLGFHHEQYFEQMPWLKTAGNETVYRLGLEISTTINPNPEQGQFSSLQCAIAFLQDKYMGFTERPPGRRPLRAGGRTPNSELFFRSEKIPGAFVLPVDVPCPGKEVFEKLAEAFNHSIDAVIPQYQSKGGHPVLLSAGFLRLLAKVPLTSADARLDLQIRPLPKNRIALVSVHDKNIQLNMNSLDEFKEYAQKVEETYRT